MHYQEPFHKMVGDILFRVHYVKNNINYKIIYMIVFYFFNVRIELNHEKFGIVWYALRFDRLSSDTD